MRLALKYFGNHLRRLSDNELTQMATDLQSPDISTRGETCHENPNLPQQPAIEVSLLTGGFDRPYAFGLATVLAANNIRLDMIGSDDIDDPELHTTPLINFLNLRGAKPENPGLAGKVSRVLIYYARLIRYVAVAKPKVFHILWNDKLELFERTVLMPYYKLRGKKVVFTAHNVNAGKRDANDTFLKRFSLRSQYQLCDHIFVHTEKMKSELLEDFGVRGEAVSVIPFGVNNSVPNTKLNTAEARRRLGIPENGKAILFFGAIRHYKGLEHLVAAFQQIAANDPSYRLIIAGAPRKDSLQYSNDIQDTVAGHPSHAQVVQRIEFVPDSETEVYFKAADLLVLPYTEVCQSGVLFLAYNFGLPVVASDVGSFRDDIVPGKTGYVCRAADSPDLARTIETYFTSDLYKRLDESRQMIRDYANRSNSWQEVAEITRGVYTELLAG